MYSDTPQLRTTTIPDQKPEDPNSRWNRMKGLFHSNCMKLTLMYLGIAFAVLIYIFFCIGISAGILATQGSSWKEIFSNYIIIIVFFMVFILLLVLIGCITYYSLQCCKSSCCEEKSNQTI